LKVPHAGTLDTPKAVRRFLREAKTAAQLRHPHIVPVYDTGHDGTHHYMASAYIAGATLAQALESGQPLEHRRVARILHDLAEALDHAHGLGIMHRDAKPENALLDEKGEALLMDFGLAHRRDSSQRLTLAGAILGTPAYMFPEQASGQGTNVLAVSDQYSLGVVFYELLCGRTPFIGPSQVVLYHVIHTQPPDPQALNPQVPPELEAICLKAMVKLPEDRYTTCRELADDLRRWLDGEAIRAAVPRPLDQPTEPVPLPPRSRPPSSLTGRIRSRLGRQSGRRLILGSVLTLIAMTLLVAWLRTRDSAQPLSSTSAVLNHSERGRFFALRRRRQGRQQDGLEGAWEVLKHRGLTMTLENSLQPQLPTHRGDRVGERHLGLAGALRGQKSN
jgi:serine/threonine protein kinase